MKQFAPKYASKALFSHGVLLQQQKMPSPSPTVTFDISHKQCESESGFKLTIFELINYRRKILMISKCDLFC